MTDQYYGINPLMGYDPMSIWGNQFFQEAWKTRNVNFKGGKESYAYDDYDTSASDSVKNNKTEDGAIPVAGGNNSSANANSNSSSFGTIATIGGLTIAGAGALWLMKKGNFAKAQKYVKSILNRGESSSTKAEGALANLRAVKCPDGKIRFNIPGKTTTRSGKDIQHFAEREYGILPAISAERQAFSASNSALEGFRVTVGTDKYVVFTKDGKITKVLDPIGENILPRLTEAESKSTDAKMLDKFEKIITELGKDKDVDKSLLKDVASIRYTNTYGDDVLKMTMGQYGDKNPVLREFTTLERFDFSSPEMQAFKLDASQDAFSKSKFFRDGELIDGIGVSRFSDKIADGYTGNFVGQELVSVVKPDGTILPKGSAGYKNFVDEHQKSIDKLVRKVFVKREYIPTGAIIETV